MAYTSGFRHFVGQSEHRARSSIRASMSASGLSRRAVAVFELTKSASSAAFMAFRQRPEPFGAIADRALSNIPNIILRSEPLNTAVAIHATPGYTIPGLQLGNISFVKRIKNPQLARDAWPQVNEPVLA